MLLRTRVCPGRVSGPHVGLVDAWKRFSVCWSARIQGRFLAPAPSSSLKVGYFCPRGSSQPNMARPSPFLPHGDHALPRSIIPWFGPLASWDDGLRLRSCAEPRHNMLCLDDTSSDKTFVVHWFVAEVWKLVARPKSASPATLIRLCHYPTEMLLSSVELVKTRSVNLLCDLNTHSLSVPHEPGAASQGTDPGALRGRIPTSSSQDAQF